MKTIKKYEVENNNKILNGIEGEIRHNKAVTVYDVAYLAGVSIATVSRVLTGANRVRPVTAEKVNYIIEKLGFVRDPNAVATAKKRSVKND